MAELYVDMEGLFEAVGEFDQEIKNVRSMYTGIRRMRAGNTAAGRFRAISGRFT